MTNRLKVGVVGAGGIFQGWGDGSGHLPGFPWLIKDASLSCICDPNENNLIQAVTSLEALYLAKAVEREERGDKVGSALLKQDAENIKTYRDLGEMLKAESLDLVDIIAPCEYHSGIVKQSLAAGCHVMCEKPLAVTWPEAEEVVKDVEKAKTFFQYGENMIFADPYYDIRKLIQKGEIGETAAVWLPFCSGEPGNYSYTKAGIGSLLDNGIHGISLAWFLIGFGYIPKRVKSLSPEGVSIRMKDRLVDGAFQELTVEDDAHFVVEFENPETGHWVNAYLEASWSYRDMEEFKVVGSKGEIRPKGKAIEICDTFSNSRQIGIFHPTFYNMDLPPGHSGFPQQLKAMVTVIKENVRPVCDVHIGAESLAVAQAVYLSEARGRKAVTVDEFKEYAKHFEGNSEGLLSELLETGIKRQ